MEPYYISTAQRLPESRRFIDQLIADCRADRFTLVHGDYSPKNILFHGDQLVLLDHEVIHFGDGTFDLGFALTHFLSKANHLPDHRRPLLLATHAFWQAYHSEHPQLTTTKTARAVRHTAACLLARVWGRSPLEYLSDTEGRRQTTLVLNLLDHLPKSIPDFIDSFHAGLTQP